jgi:hypothetical protein
LRGKIYEKKDSLKTLTQKALERKEQRNKLETIASDNKIEKEKIDTKILEEIKYLRDLTKELASQIIDSDIKIGYVLNSLNKICTVVVNLDILKQTLSFYKKIIFISFLLIAILGAMLIKALSY